MKKGLNHWECYTKLYGEELLKIAYKNYYVSRFGHPTKFYTYHINLRIDQLVNFLPVGTSIGLDKGVYDVKGSPCTNKCHIKGEGINKTIIRK
jgi:hypothetical protein